MKKLATLFLSIALLSYSYAQVDRSKRPEAGPAPELNFGEYKIYEMDNGLKVIVVEDHKLPRVTMSLIVDRGPIFEGDKAGYVGLAGDMLRQGTTTRPKDKLDEEVDYMGANLNTSSSSISMGGLSKYSAKLMEIMADVALNPSFPQSEFEKLQKQSISGLESAKDNPDAIANKVFSLALYGKDHPYGESPSIESVESITVEDCRNYYNTYWIPNNSYLAIVGDIKPKTAKKLVKKYLGKWKRGEVKKQEFQAPMKPEGKAISFVNKDNSVQSVINLGNTIELKPGAPDEVMLRLTNQILGGGSLGRLFKNIREDKAYTYGAYSNYDTDRYVGSFRADASVRNEVTDSAIVEFLAEFNRIRTEPVSEEELAGAKKAIIGAVGRSLERPSTIASYALNIQRYNLPEDYYETYLNRLEAVTANDVMNTAQKYIQTDNMDITVVGKASEVAELLERFGKIQYYDVDGNETAKPVMKLPVPDGVTAQTVIDQYLKAIGGMENLKKVNDVQIVMNVEIPGAPMKLTAVEMKKKPMMVKSSLMGEGLPGPVQQLIYNGKKGKSSNMQTGTKMLEGDDLIDAKMTSYMFIEAKYTELGYTLNLDRVAMMDGKKVYVMEVTSPTGEKSTEYYSVESGLKVKTETAQETPQGPMVSSTSFADYREVKGVKFPYMQITSFGPQTVKAVASEIKVNEGIPNSEFIVE